MEINSQHRSYFCKRSINPFQIHVCNKKYSINKNGGIIFIKPKKGLYFFTNISKQFPCRLDVTTRYNYLWFYDYPRIIRSYIPI